MNNLRNRHDKIAIAGNARHAVVKQRANAMREQAQKPKQLEQYYYYYGDYYGEEEETETAEEVEEEGRSKPDGYWEAFTYGVIQGFAGTFDGTCVESLNGTVRGGFDIMSYWHVWDPRNTIKFQMAINQVTLSVNSVYAFCDFRHLFNQFVYLADYEDWENYITLATRSLGSLIQELPDYAKCIRQGQEGMNGYDVGICGGGAIATLLDTQL